MAEAARQLPLRELIELFYSKQQDDSGEANTSSHQNLLNKVRNYPNQFFACTIELDASLRLVARPDGGGEPMPLRQSVSVQVGSRQIVRRDRDGTCNIAGPLEKEVKYHMLSRPQQEKMLAESPEEYRVCVLRLIGPQEGRAVPVGTDDTLEKILLTGRSNCGHACEGDEVLVHVKEKVDASTARGVVVGLWKAKEKLKYKLFVCQLLRDCGTLMKPLCGSFPKIGYDNGHAREQFEAPLTIENNSPIQKAKQRLGLLSAAERAKEKHYEYVNDHFVSIYTPHFDPQRQNFVFTGTGIEEVSKHNCESLFIVCFVQWPASNWYPLGRVVHVLKSTDSLHSMLEVLQVRYSVPPLIFEDNEVQAAVAKIQQLVDSQHQIDSNRNDFRKHFTVTIDNPSTKDMDDAISLSQARDGSLTVGIHITDVADFIPEDSVLDRLARTRGFTFYPPKEAAERGVPVNHMLPRKLAEDALSLTAGQDRKCQSVILKIRRDSQNEPKVVSRRVLLTTIRSDRRLNKEDVQQALVSGDGRGSVELDERSAQKLRLLWQYASEMRIARLGPAALCNRPLSEPNFEASCLVEEMMVEANRTVGEFLASHATAPDFPLRVQEKPRDVDVESWLELHRGCASHSAELERALKLAGKSVERSNWPFKMYRSDVDQIAQLCNRDKRQAVLMLFDETRFPNLRLALHHWHAISAHAEYRPSGGDLDRHFGLDITNYVHFTSPLRRYPDLMVQREVRAALLSGEATSVTRQDELIATCDWISVMSTKNSRFGGDCESLQRAVELQSRPRRVVAIVESVDENGLYVLHELLGNSPKVARQLQFRQMSLAAAPDMKVVEHGAQCKWRCRVLLHPTASNDDAHGHSASSHRHQQSVRVSGNQFITSFRSQEILRVKDEIIKKKGKYDDSTISYRRLMEADCNSGGVKSVFCRSNGMVGSQSVSQSTVAFHRDVHPGEAIAVQVGAQQTHGILTPAIQLVEVCDSFCLCQMHRRRPVDCFETAATQKILQEYADVQEYTEVWQPLVAMESATVAVSSKDSATICDVPLKWSFDEENGRWLGMFNLTETFCQSSSINFTDCCASESLKSVARKFHESMNSNSRKKSEGIQDVSDAVFKVASSMHRYAEYLCVRAKAAGNPESTWVGHGGILFVFSGIHGRSEKCNDSNAHFCNFVTFHLRSMTHGGSLPKPPPERADVEILFKFLPSRRQELVIQTLKEMPDLGIPYTLVRWKEQFRAVGTDSLLYRKTLKKHRIHSLQDGMKKLLGYTECNERQLKALNQAIERKVTIIWGPPGTGKTTTGILLLFWFAFINRGSQNDEDASENGDAYEATETSPPKGETVSQLMEKKAENEFQEVKRRGRRNPRAQKPQASERRRWRMKRKRVTPQARRQILCCGPSNRSVDVILEEAKTKLGENCPEMVRVYSDQVERYKYPIPGEAPSAYSEAVDTEVTAEMEKFALHELIRTEDGEEAEIIRGFDLMFREVLKVKSELNIRILRRAIKSACDENAWFKSFVDQEKTSAESMFAGDGFDCDSSTEMPWETVLQHFVKRYKRKVVDAKTRVLQNFEVVLCTTSVSSSSVIQRACRFVQIVIDEAGMCTQPDLLVPLVGRLTPEMKLPDCLGCDSKAFDSQTHKLASQFAERTVLVGDHKQLKPIIQNRTAAEFGLQTTFLEQHCLDSVMLNDQYRMHPSLADFPSCRFYSVQEDGGLRTRPSASWTGLTKEEAERSGRLQWTGLDAHLMRMGDLFDCRDGNGNRRHGLLTHRNVNVLHGCWPGVRRKAFRTLPEVDPENDSSCFHPKGEEERIAFLNVTGVEEKTVVATEQGREDSYKNEKEIGEAIRVYKEILNRLSGDERRTPEHSVAIISQYKYQITEIAARLRSERLPMPTVKTVIACQGSEFNYVILSLVRSRPDYEIPEKTLPGWDRKYLGFITDENQINVALTRARRGLVIFGNQRLLRKSQCWAVLLEDLKSRGCLVSNPQFFPNRTGDRRCMTRTGVFR